MKGYIYLYRKIQESWIWSRPDYFQWFIAIIFKANYKRKKIWFGRKIEDVNRGSFITSIRKFAAELPQCSEQKLRTFLNLLEEDKIITITILSKRATQITVLNYDTYQDSRHSHNTELTQKQHTTDTMATQSIYKNQHKNNIETTKNTTHKISQEKAVKTGNYSKKYSETNTVVTQRKKNNNTMVTQPRNKLEIIKSENQQQHNKRIKELKKDNKKVSNSEKENSSESPPEILKLFDSITKYFPKKIIESLNPKNKKAWIDTLEKLNRIDGYTFQEIEKMIRITRNHIFWSKNFLSLTKLRKSDKDGVKYHIRFSQLTEKTSGKINAETKDFSKEKNRMSWN